MLGTKKKKKKTIELKHTVFWFGSKQLPVTFRTRAVRFIGSGKPKQEDAT